MAKIVAAVISSMIALTSLPALAEGSGCQVKGEAICGLGQGALLSSTEGNASVSRGGSFKPLQASATLRSGDRILLKSDAGTIKLGDSCSTPIGPGSLASISRRGGSTCVSEVKDAAGLKAEAGSRPIDPDLAFLPDGITPVQIAAGLGALVVIGVPLGITLSNSSTPRVSGQ